MKRRIFLKTYARAVVGAGLLVAGSETGLTAGFGTPWPLRPGGRFRRFRVGSGQRSTVREVTLAVFPPRWDSYRRRWVKRVRLRGLLFVRVGPLNEDLQFIVNGQMPLAPAAYCPVNPGDVIEWREV